MAYDIKYLWISEILSKYDIWEMYNQSRTSEFLFLPWLLDIFGYLTWTFFPLDSEGALGLATWKCHVVHIFWHGVYNAHKLFVRQPIKRPKSHCCKDLTFDFQFFSATKTTKQEGKQGLVELPFWIKMPLLMIWKCHLFKCNVQ